MSFRLNNLITLENICVKITDGSHFSPKKIKNGFPMLSVKDMNAYGFDYSSCKRISQDNFDKMLKSDCVPLKDDILIAKDGSYLKYIFVVKENRKEAILSSIAIIRPDISKVMPDYLCYVLKNPMMKQVIKDNYVSGSAIPRIVLKDFKKIYLRVPSFSEQKFVTSILLSLDKKIEINNQINKP